MISRNLVNRFVNLPPYFMGHAKATETFRFPFLIPPTPSPVPLVFFLPSAVAT